MMSIILSQLVYVNDFNEKCIIYDRQWKTYKRVCYRYKEKEKNDEYVNPGNIFVTLSLEQNIKNQYAVLKKGPKSKNKSVLVIFIISNPQGDTAIYGHDCTGNIDLFFFGKTMDNACSIEKRLIQNVFLWINKRLLL